MRSRLVASRRLALVAAPLPFLACSFVLDFDELEDQGDVERIGFGGATSTSSGAGGRETTTSDTTTDGSVGGSAAGQAGADPGVGGSGSLEECGGDCDDRDPCTRDFCDVSQSPPACAHSDRVGLFDDGLALSLTAETFHRATMAGGPDEFYISAFRATEGVTETTLYSLSRNGDEIVEHFRATELGEGSPVSAMGFVAEDQGGFVLHAYMGFADEVGGTNPRVNHLRFDDLSSPDSTVVAFGYDASVPERYPKGFLVDGEVHGAWIDLGGAIPVHLPSGMVVTLNANPGVPARATSFAPLASATRPGVLFSRSRGGVFAQLRGGDPVEFDECGTTPEAYLSMSSADVDSQGVWLTGWTVESQQEVSSVSKLTVCPDDGDCVSQSCQIGVPVTFNVRNPARAVAPLSGREVLLATATPTVSGAGDVELTVMVERVDYGSVPGIDEAQIDRIGPVRSVVTMPLEGPDLPAVSFSRSDKLALSWIEPDPGLGVTALRVRRYDVCLPPD